MFSLLDLRFALCSRDLYILRAQRIIGFYLNYPQINEIKVSDRMLIIELSITLGQNAPSQ